MKTTVDPQTEPSYKETDRIFGTHYGVTHSDVFGKYDMVGHVHTRIDAGMVVAAGKHRQQVVCPVFGDVVPYKSVTVICTEDQLNGVLQHLAQAHGGQLRMTKHMPDGRIAIRSDYQCW